MPRIARLIVKGEPAVYHIISRTVLNGFVMGDIEKDYLLNLIKRLSRVYFSEVLGFCLLGNHFHLLVRMLPTLLNMRASIQLGTSPYLMGECPWVHF